MNMKDEVERLVSDFLKPKPRSICICNDPDPGEFDPIYLWAKCKTCGQDLSKERCVFNNIGC